jgi:hypothetical protein
MGSSPPHSVGILPERDCVRRTSRSAGNAGTVTSEQQARIGNRTDGGVFLFLRPDDFQRDYRPLTTRGMLFMRLPREESLGTAAVVEALDGNLWDLLQLRDQAQPEVW